MNMKMKNPVSWWDNECNRMKRLRTASFKKWEFSGNITDLIKYKEIVPQLDEF